MSTTSLKLPKDVKRLAVTAAKHRGVTPHAFMVDAIRQVATTAERRARFLSEAERSRDETIRSGRGYAADEVHLYLRARVQGKAASKPRARAWRG